MFLLAGDLTGGKLCNLPAGGCSVKTGLGRFDPSPVGQRGRLGGGRVRKVVAKENEFLLFQKMLI